jgi:hypothetical protein
LQRRVELANAHLKQFKCLGTTFRKGAFRDLEIIGVVVPKLVFIDLLLNQEHSGHVHMSGPTPDPIPLRPAAVVVGPGAFSSKKQEARARPSAQQYPQFSKTNRSLKIDASPSIKFFLAIYGALGVAVFVRRAESHVL